MRSLLLGLLLCQWSSVALSASANLIRHRKLDSSASSSTSLNSTTNSTISHSSTSSSQSSTSSPVALTPEAGKLSTTTSDAITPIPLGTVTSTTTRTSTTTAAAANVINVIHFGAIGLGAELGLGSSSSSSSSTSSTSSATSSATSTATSATTSTTSSATTPVWNATSPSLPATTTSDGLMHMDGFGMVSVDLTSTPPISLPPTATPPAITGGNPPFPLSNGTLPPFPLGNGTGAIGPTGTGRPDVCGGCTVNVRGASVDYWFPATYLYHTGTLSTVTVGSTSFYSLVYNTSPYNVTQTMLESAYTTTVSYFAEWDFYITLMDMYTTTPSAVSTIMVPRSSVLPVTGLINLDDSESLSIDPGPATVNVPLPSGTVSIATSTTPFVYFTVYEVVSRSQVTQNGQVVCSTATASFNLSQPFAFDYTGDSLEVASAAQGDIPSAFLQTIPQASCVPGKYSGDVYVLVVVDIAYDIQFNAEPFAAHGESTATSGFPSQTFSPENGHLPTTGSGNGDGGGGIGSIIVSIIGDGGETTSDPFTPEGGTLPKTTTIPRNTRTALQDNLPTTTSSGPVVVGSQTASQGSSSQVIIGSQTLTPGGPPVTIGSTVVSLGPSGTAIVVGGTTSKLGNTTPGGVIVGSQTTTKPVPVLTIGGSTITGNAATQFSVGPGATLTPGGTVVVSGTTISLDPSASFVVVGGSTQVLPTAAPTSPNGGVFTVGDSSVTGNAGSTFVIQGQTLSPGGSPITISGPGGSTTISLVGGGSTVVVNGNTEVITPVITPAPITLGGTVFSVTDGSTFVIGGQTLVPGQIITFTDGSGQVSTVSLGPSASFVVVNGQTSVLEGPITGAPLLTIGGIVYTAVSGGTTYVIDGQTLTPGGVITVDGTTISLDPYATALVINGQTETLFPATTTGDGMITTTDGRGGITTNTPVNTGAATTTKKKGAAGSLRAANKGEFLTIGISAFLAAFAVGATICL